MKASEPGPISFGDNVRVRRDPATDALGLGGLIGQVYGETTPSVSAVEVIGTADEDYAINVHFEELGRSRWFAPHLLELVDHAPGTTIGVDGVDKQWTRTVDGEWVEEPLDTVAKRPWWRFW